MTAGSTAAVSAPDGGDEPVGGGDATTGGGKKTAAGGDATLAGGDVTEGGDAPAAGGGAPAVGGDATGGVRATASPEPDVPPQPTTAASIEDTTAIRIATMPRWRGNVIAAAARSGTVIPVISLPPLLCVAFLARERRQTYEPDLGDRGDACASDPLCDSQCHSLAATANSAIPLCRFRAPWLDGFR